MSEEELKQELPEVCSPPAHVVSPRFSQETLRYVLVIY